MENQLKKRIPVVLLTEAEQKLVSKISSEPKKPEAIYVKKVVHNVSNIHSPTHVIVPNPCIILERPYLVAQESNIIPIIVPSVTHKLVQIQNPAFFVRI